MTAMSTSLMVARSSRTVKSATTSGGATGILSTDRFDDFRTCQAQVVDDGDIVGVSYDTMQALDLREGDRARFWRHKG